MSQTAIHPTATDPKDPTPSSADAIRHLLDRQLSTRSRLAHVVLLVVDLAALGVVASLWLTEPALPARTHIAFALLVVLGVAWAVHHVWVLTQRKPLDARQGIAAGRLALTGCGLFTAGAGLVALLERTPGALAAAVYGIALLTLAALLLERARRQREALLLLRATLERQLVDRPHTDQPQTC